jgi:hypothetical protein
MDNHQKIGGAVITFGVLALIFFTFMTVILPKVVRPTTELNLGNGVFKASIALNEAERMKGLSGVTKMSSDEALIMAYKYESRWKIWMKDIKIPLDIIWLDQTKKVIYIVKNAVPEDSTTKTFEPKGLAAYVVELPAGSVKANSIDIGQVADFKLKESDIR